MARLYDIDSSEINEQFLGKLERFKNALKHYFEPYINIRKGKDNHEY